MSSIKKTFIVTIILILAIIPTACSQDSSTSSKKTLEIIWRHTASSEAKQWFEKVKKEFKKKHKDVVIKLNPVKTSEGSYPSKKALMLKSAETAPDIVAEDTYVINSDAAAGYLTPLTDRVKKWDDWSKFYDKVKQGVTSAEGEVYGVPTSTDTRGLWYNVNLFKEAGLQVPWHPQNWNDILTAAKALKGVAPVPFWLNTGKATGEATTMQTFEMLLYGTGDTLYNKDSGKWIVKSDGFLDSLKFINKIYDNDLGPRLSQVLTGQANTILQQKLMPKEKVGIVLNGSWLPAFWREGGPNPWPEALDVYKFTAMPTQNGQGPGYTSMSGGWSLAIPDKSDNKDLAWEFIKLATTKENMKFNQKVSGTLTPRKDIAKDPEYLNAPHTVNKKATEFLEFTHYRPTYAKYPVVSTKIQAAVEAVATGALDPKEAMNQFAKDVKRSVGAKNVTKKP